jgi:hypothetical protein
VISVEAQTGVIREVRAELDEERAEVLVHTVEVEVVDHPGGLHDPRVGDALGVTAFLGAEHRGLLLGAADEDHTLGLGVPGQVLVHHVVLTLASGEVDPGHLLIAGEPVHRCAEPVADLGDGRGRGDRQPHLPVDVPDQTSGELQPRDVDVAVHPVTTKAANCVAWELSDRKR